VTGLEAAARAGELVAAVRDDPAGRLRLATGFYEQRAAGTTAPPSRSP
jgi:hypothetical protein